jgi:DNA modification methylase
MVKIIQGDCRETLKTLGDRTVQCVVTSPPYYGLRDYGTATWEGGDQECEHTINNPDADPKAAFAGRVTRGNRTACLKCGAIRVDDQIGLEETPEEYVAKLVELFREVRRVLKDDGTLFLNLGDSYFGGGGAHKPEHANPGLSRSASRGGVPHAKPYGTSGKEPASSPERGCLCGNLCDECRRAYRIGKSHSGNLPVPMQSALLSESTPEHKELQPDHLPTLDLEAPEVRNDHAIQDFENSKDREGEPPPVSPVSMLDLSFRQPQEYSRQLDKPSICLLCGRSFLRSVQGYVDKLDERQEQVLHSQDNALPSDQQEYDNQYKDTVCEYCKEIASYRDCTIASHLKSKDLIGIPWMVAFALRADGWYLRSDIIWHKPNPMPESVTDRPTKSHEYIFLLTKSARYYYDAEAIKEPASGRNGSTFDGERDLAVRPTTGRGPRNDPKEWTFGQQKRIDRVEATGGAVSGGTGEIESHGTTRNKRSVWTVSTKPYSGAHFATFPPDLIEPCILAGTSEKGECRNCGKAWARVVEKETNTELRNLAGKNNDAYQRGRVTPRGSEVGDFHDLGTVSIKQLGWAPQCDCDFSTVPQIVLDPFNGAGTTGLVAIKHNRDYIGLELNPEYIKLTEDRLNEIQQILIP